MQIVRDLQELPDLARGSAVTIGNFDGVHLAHRRLLQRVAASAHAGRVTSVAVTFHPHPIRVLTPHRAPQTLTSMDQKIKLIAELGIDALVVLQFTRELAHLSPEEFVRRILVERLRARMVWVGSNFRFGYRQAGDVETLSRLGRKESFDVDIVSTVRIRGQLVSSTRIRQLLAAGRVYMAARLLGRPFSNSGRIVAGLGVGRRHTVPTLNLESAEEQLPAPGIYVTCTRLAGVTHFSVTNVGHKPTFGEHPMTVETHLLDFEGSVREEEMEVEYLHRLRDEIRFQNAALLKLQIQEDIRRARKFFRLVDNFHIEKSALR